MAFAGPGMFTADLRLVRQINRTALLNCVRQKGRISRTDLARLTGLTSATCFSIVDELRDMNLLVADGVGSSHGGRRPILFRFNPAAFHVAGVDIGGLGRMVTVVTQLDGRVLARAESPLLSHPDPADLLFDILSSVRHVVDEAGLSMADIRGTGLAMPGMVDDVKGVLLYSTNLGWEDVAMAAPLCSALDHPVWVENNARAMALGEAACGAGSGFNNIVAINIGVGIGAGIVINGQLYRGSEGLAGEIGHTTVVEEGPLCRCGNRGCLEALAASAAIMRKVSNAMWRGVPTRIGEMAGGCPEAITVDLVCRAAAEGDLLSVQVVEEAGSYLGVGVANFINLLNPQVVIIGGAVAQAGNLLLDPVRHSVAARALGRAACHARIVPAALGIDAASIGAAMLVLEKALVF